MNMNQTFTQRRNFLAGASALALLPWSMQSLAQLSDRPSILGSWRAIDGDTPYAVIEFKQVEDSISGFLREQLSSPKVLVCSTKCPPSKRGQPVTGLECIWGLKSNADPLYFEGGQVLLPDDGSQFQCRVTVLPSGNSLRVRLFVGTPIFGSTEIWQRV